MSNSNSESKSQTPRLQQNKKEKPPLIVNGKINPALVLSPHQILACSLVSDVIFRVSINPIEVAKVRVSKDLIFCKPQTCEFFGAEDLSQCRKCLPSRKLGRSMLYLWRTDGIGLFYNGLMDKIGAGLVRSGSFFPIYEHRK
jgi:hypothetical protein